MQHIAFSSEHQCHFSQWGAGVDSRWPKSFGHLFSKHSAFFVPRVESLLIFQKGADSIESIVGLFLFMSRAIIFSFLSCMDHVMHPHPSCSDFRVSNKKEADSKPQWGCVNHTVAVIKILLSERQEARAAFYFSQRFISSLLSEQPALSCPKKQNKTQCGFRPLYYFIQTQ